MPLSRRDFLRMAAVTMGTAGVGAASYGWMVEKRWIERVELDLTLPRLPPSFDGYRIAHISDLHMDGLGMTPRQLGRIADWINDLAPNVVMVTGDFVTVFERRFAPLAAEGLAKLNAPDGVVASLGNHDHWTNVDTVTGALNEAGVTVLRNDVHTLHRANDRLHIAGVDDAYVRAADLEQVLQTLPDDNHTALLLAHEPDFADVSTASGRFDLQLSGHSHGGQIRVPGVGAPVLPHLGKKYPVGLYRVGDMWQYTNRGLGSSIPNVRYACRAEITLFTLRSPLGSAISGVT